jgi:hypothetical protein
LKRRRIKLSLAQSTLLSGVLSFGVFMFIYTMTMDYFEWRLLGGSPAHLTSGWLAYNACFCLAFGVFLGRFAYSEQGKSPATKHPPS